MMHDVRAAAAALTDRELLPPPPPLAPRVHARHCRCVLMGVCAAASHHPTCAQAGII